MATTWPTFIPELETRDIKRRPQRWGMKMRFITGIIILALYVLFLRSRRASVPKVVGHDFGVAFDLTPSYGYVSCPEYPFVS